MRSALLNAPRSAAAVMLAVAVGVAGCGSSSSSSSSSSKSSAGTTSAQPAASATTLALSIAESGKASKYTGPTSVKGGLVTVKLMNSGKAPHGAQLVRILGKHTIIQALMKIGGQKTKTPSWLHAEGGVGFAAPGTSASATVDLPAGNYAIADVAGAQSGSGGPPAFAPLTVTPGQSAPVPASATTVTAAAPSKDHYKWQIAGSPLKVGANNLTFVSKGTQTLHVLDAVRITGNPSNAQITRDLNSNSNGPPPSYVDTSSQVQTAVLDDGKSLSTQLTLSKPGKYLLFCTLHDRNGGKRHYAEGLLTRISVK